MTFLIFLFALMGSSQADPVITDNRIPDGAVVAAMEARIVMPTGAEPLEKYDRKYTQARVDGKDMILGQLIDHRLTVEIAHGGHGPLPPPVRRVLMDDIQMVFDGGCGIITVTYELGSSTPPKAFCNPQGPHPQ
ncbi:hypothetical protein QH494_23935 [Sphingomonas sp. AR_OL41]|uniref:hypothetical protein n=1 Tax=Sphingomonas sp. AR_OL41 TaxID=3042729 RepID=UPI00247FFB49|nr:hypothetical protein [Sphingomonas sp. AR_OL41]MDH7975247.1 hypothetical protein [Sphingomonas sp. AR_OL41]